MKQPITKFRKQAAKIQAAYKELIEKYKIVGYHQPALIEIYKMDSVATERFGTWHVQLDVEGAANFRSIWLFTRFDVSNELTSTTNRKWNHCLFQTLQREPLTDEGVDKIVETIHRCFLRATATPQHTKTND